MRDWEVQKWRHHVGTTFELSVSRSRKTGRGLGKDAFKGRALVIGGQSGVEKGFLEVRK